MPRILAAATAMPSNVVTQDEVRHAISGTFGDRLPNLETALGLFDRTRIRKRHLIRPLGWYGIPHGVGERNHIYLEEGGELLAAAADRCLRMADCPSEAIDHVIAVSSSGHAAPSLDARLISRLGLRRDATRLPIWGLGCAGGAAGLARAFDYCRAHPRARTLLVALETCSLTFCPEDASKKNLVAAAIFGDGAGAVLVSGEEAGGYGPRLLASQSYLFPESDRIMGWDFLEEGMQLVLSPRLPALVKTELAGLVDRFLYDHGLARSDLIHYLAHPGGAKVIDAYHEALDLQGDELALTEKVLAGYGNLSSVSVLVVLEEWLASDRARQKGYGLISAFGPGFSAEQVLLEV